MEDANSKPPQLDECLSEVLVRVNDGYPIHQRMEWAEAGGCDRCLVHARGEIIAHHLSW